MLQEKFFFISAVCSVLAARLCLLADDFERDRSSMSPPPWLVMAAIKDVVTLLDRFRRSAAGPIFCKIIEITVLNMKEWFEGLESVLVEYKR